jgi:hypothetical protein
MKRLYFLLAFACLATATLWAADDPFCGKWKLNMEKSKFTGERTTIQNLGGNKYKWTSGNDTNIITFDGTDQPMKRGNTLSMAPEGPNSWKMVIKKDGRVLSTMTHTVSDDGKTQTIKGTSTRPDGTTSVFDVKLKRISGGPGIAGTWENADVKFTGAEEWEISPFEGDGLTFNAPAYQDTLSMKFDGKDYEEKGPNVAAGSTSSGKRVDARTLAVVDKIKGELTDHTTYKVSPDGKTLTLTIQDAGQPKPITIVYDKI